MQELTVNPPIKCAIRVFHDVCEAMEIVICTRNAVTALMVHCLSNEDNERKCWTWHAVFSSRYHPVFDTSTI